jgi:hypothetical protein
MNILNIPNSFFTILPELAFFLSFLSQFLLASSSASGEL